MFSLKVTRMVLALSARRLGLRGLQSLFQCARIAGFRPWRFWSCCECEMRLAGENSSNLFGECGGGLLPWARCRACRLHHQHRRNHREQAERFIGASFFASSFGRIIPFWVDGIPPSRKNNNATRVGTKRSCADQVFQWPPLLALRRPGCPSPASSQGLSHALEDIVGEEELAVRGTMTTWILSERRSAMILLISKGDLFRSSASLVMRSALALP